MPGTLAALPEPLLELVARALLDLYHVPFEVEHALGARAQLTRFALVCRATYGPGMRAAVSRVNLARNESEFDASLLDLVAARPALCSAARRVTVGGVNSPCADWPYFMQWPPTFDEAPQLIDRLFGALSGVRSLALDYRAWKLGGCAWERNAGLETLGARQTVRRLELSGDLRGVPGEHEGEIVVAHLIAPFAGSLSELKIDHAVELLRGAARSAPLAALRKLRTLSVEGVALGPPISSGLVDAVFGAADALRSIYWGVMLPSAIDSRSFGRMLDGVESLRVALADGDAIDLGWIPVETELKKLHVELYSPRVLAPSCAALSCLGITELRLSNTTRIAWHDPVFVDMIEAPASLPRLQRLVIGHPNNFTWSSNGMQDELHTRLAAACHARGVELKDRIKIWPDGKTDNSTGDEWASDDSEG